MFILRLRLRLVKCKADKETAKERDRSHRNSDCDSPRKNGIIANGAISNGVIDVDGNGGPANGIDHSAVNASNPMGPSGLV